MKIKTVWEWLPGNEEIYDSQKNFKKFMGATRFWDRGGAIWFL